MHERNQHLKHEKNTMGCGACFSGIQQIVEVKRKSGDASPLMYIKRPIVYFCKSFNFLMTSKASGPETPLSGPNSPFISALMTPLSTELQMAL